MQRWVQDIVAHQTGKSDQDFSSCAQWKGVVYSQHMPTASENSVVDVKSEATIAALPSSGSQTGRHERVAHFGPLPFQQPPACTVDSASSNTADDRQQSLSSVEKKSAFISKYFPSSCVSSSTFNLKKAISLKYADSMKSSSSAVSCSASGYLGSGFHNTMATGLFHSTTQSSMQDQKKMDGSIVHRENKAQPYEGPQVSDDGVSSTSKGKPAALSGVQKGSESRLPRQYSDYVNLSLAIPDTLDFELVRDQRMGLSLDPCNEQAVKRVDEWSHFRGNQVSRATSSSWLSLGMSTANSSCPVSSNTVTDNVGADAEALGKSDMDRACVKPLNLKEDSCEMPHTTGWEVSPKHTDNGFCQVCGDVAAGFYCGAFVCEACKKFFIRASKQEKNKFVCLRHGACKITKESRVQCQYCRYQKCLELQMYYPGEGKRSVARVGISEIPCRVCGAPSSGFHFGALTCEGCKGFFRRMVKEREPGTYRCSAGGVCEISTHTRNMCKACRFQKCVSIGMSVEGSRIGRQPNAVKHAISLEVKKQCVDMGSKSSLPAAFPESAIFSTSKTVGAIQPLDDGSSSFQPPVSTPTSSCIKEETHSPSFCLQEMDLLEVPACGIMPGTVTVKEEPEDDVDYSMMQASLEAAGAELAHIVLKERAQSDMFDEQSFGSPTSIWSRMMRHFEFHAQCIIRFAKKVPGFRKLEIDDQVTLVQHSTYPLVILNHARSYSLDTGYYNYFNFTKHEEKAIFEIFPVFLALREHFTHIGFIAQTMKLTDLEYTFLSCILLLDSECQGLKAVQEVLSLHNQILYFFQLYEERTREDGSSRFGEILLRISELALANVQHGQTIATFLAEHPNLEVPRLFHEMFF